MRSHDTMTRAALAALGLAALSFALGAVAAGKPAKRPSKPAVAAPAPPPPAGPEQLDAARLVYFGRYDCEFSQSIDVSADERHPGYVDVRHGKSRYLAKPVLSPTGVVRLEDLKGEVLVLQIASKSMVMNVKTGRRLVDECVSATQRELTEVAARAKAAEAAASAAAMAASAAQIAATAASAAAAAASDAAGAASAVPLR